MAYAPSTARDRRHHEDIELNLLPFMNLMTLLIPFLLMSATFVHLAVVEAALPAIAHEKVGPVEDGLDLKLAVTETGFVLRGSGVFVLGTEVDDGFVAEFATLDELSFAAVQLKAQWPGETGFVIASDEGVAWHRLIAAMDVMRDAENADGSHKALFPHPVFAGGLSHPAASQ